MVVFSDTVAKAMMDTMKYYSVLPLLFFIIALGSTTTGSFADDTPSPFNKLELETFCADLPEVLDSLNKDELELYFSQITKDYSSTLFEHDPERNFPSSLSSTRFNYILNHTLLAGVVKDMGGFGEAKLDFLQSQRDKVMHRHDISQKVKERVLAELDISIAQVEELKRQTEALPRSELVLLWRKQELLNELLIGVVPIKKQTRAAQ